MLHWFEVHCVWLEINSDAELKTLQELNSKISELACESSVYCAKRLTQKPEEGYGNKLYFAEADGKSNIVCFQSLIDYYFNDLRKKGQKEKKRCWKDSHDCC